MTAQLGICASPKNIHQTYTKTTLRQNSAPYYGGADLVCDVKCVLSLFLLLMLVFVRQLNSVAHVDLKSLAIFLPQPPEVLRLQVWGFRHELPHPATLLHSYFHESIYLC